MTPARLRRFVVAAILLGVGAAHADSIDKAPIRRVVKQHMPSIKRCYDQVQKQHPTAEGNLVAKWSILGDGTTGDVSASGVHADLEACVAKLIQRWRFPKAPGNKPIIVNYPFRFARGS